jgi:hypothetical protein
VVRNSSCKILFSIILDASPIQGCYIPAQKKLCVAASTGIKLFSCVYDEESLRLEELAPSISL